MKEIDFWHAAVYGRLFQVYLQADFKEKALEIYEQMKQKNVPLNATMFTDCSTFVPRLDPYIGHVLGFVTEHPEIEMTIYSTSLGARYFALACDVPAALRLFHILPPTQKLAQSKSVAP